MINCLYVSPANKDDETWSRLIPTGFLKAMSDLPQPLSFLQYCLSVSHSSVHIVTVYTIQKVGSIFTGYPNTLMFV
jgi:hypothetical protein